MVKLDIGIINLWISHQKIKHARMLHLLRSLKATRKANGNKLRITSNDIGSPSVDVCVWLKTPLWDRVTNYIGQVRDWLGDWSKESRPIWMHEWEWQWWFNVKDLRWADPSDTEESIWYKGTGFNGLNEFDLENAIRQALSQHGIVCEVVFESNDPILGQVTATL
jgi:hypothetical protein